MNLLFFHTSSYQALEMNTNADLQKDKHMKMTETPLSQSQITKQNSQVFFTAVLQVMIYVKALRSTKAFFQAGPRPRSVCTRFHVQLTTRYRTRILTIFILENCGNRLRLRKIEYNLGFANYIWLQNRHASQKLQN